MVFYTPFRGDRFPRRESLTVDSQGNVRAIRGDNDLPFMLGQFCSIPFFPLPDPPLAAWTYKRDFVLGYVDDDGSRRPVSPFDRSRTTLAATETADYELEPPFDADVVAIRRDYTMESAERIDSHPRVKLAGEGRLLFNRSLGRLESYKAELLLQKRNQFGSVEQRVAVSLTVVSHEELLRRAKEIEARRPKLLTDAERTKVLEQLAATDDAESKLAIEKLQWAISDRPSDISAALVQRLKRGDDPHRGQILDAFFKWAHAEHTPQLLSLLDSETGGMRRKIIDTLGKAKDPRGAARLAQLLDVTTDRGQAEQALKQFGGEAEQFVLPLLKSNQSAARISAVTLLREFKSSKSRLAIERVAREDADAAVRSHANVMLRLLGAPPPPETKLGQAVKADEVLAAGDLLTANWAGRWLDVRVLEILPDGRVRIRWVGWSDVWDESVGQTELRRPVEEPPQE